MSKGLPFPSDNSIPSSIFTRIKKLWIKFLDNPFDFVDNFSFQFPKKRYEWNFLRNDEKLSWSILVLSHFCVILWLVCGWDSSVTQLEHSMLAIPDLLTGNKTLNDIAFIYQDEYGKGMHYSAFVIYGFMYFGLSKYYREKLDLTGSRNCLLAFSLTFLSIGMFETFWHINYDIFQEQPWILSWAFPQFRILFQTFILWFVGFFTIFIVNLKHEGLYRLGKLRNTIYVWKPQTFMPQLRLRLKDKWTFALLIGSILSMSLWIGYGLLFPVESLTVDVKGSGLWTNSIYFPQTVYTVEIDVTDNINAGDQYFVENDLLHGVNTLCKVLFTALLYNMGRMKKVENKKSIT